MRIGRAGRIALAVSLVAALGCAAPAPEEQPSVGPEPEAPKPPSPAVTVLIDRLRDDVAVPAPFDRISIRNQRADDCTVQVDGFDLRVETKDGRTVDFTFTSSYGRFQVHVIPALAGGEALLCLRTGVGRGTDVREETLRLFRLKESALQRVLSVPLGVWRFVEENVPPNTYHEASWSVADTDDDGVAEVMVSPSNAQTWTSADCDVYRWVDSRGMFFKR